MKDILITPEGIRKNLRNIKPLEAICEYIWNGFDAEATEVRIRFFYNDFGLVNMLEIEDNGIGICYEELSAKFQKFNDSSKYDSLKNKTLPHGRRGIGRLTFFSFATNCLWQTVYSKGDDNYEYFISMERDRLNQYDDNNGNPPNKTLKKTGTTVRMTQMESLNKEDVIEAIKSEFFWFLELNSAKEYKIYVDDEVLSYEDCVIKRIPITVSELELKHDYDIVFVHWNRKMGDEYSRIYYIDSDNKERYKETTKLNKKSDYFYHSIFIRSVYFNDFHWGPDPSDNQRNLFPNRTEDEYKKLIEYVNKYVISYRQKFLKTSSNDFISKLIKDDIYPTFEDSAVGQYQKEQLDEVVEALYITQPKVFTGLNTDNKKIFIGMLNLIVEKGNKPELFEILKQIVDLTDEERDELANVLRYTSFNRITRTVQLLADRQQTIQVLKEIVFTKDFATYEAHVQKIVEEHYWIFGEQYNLITAAEPDFEQALQGLIMKTTGNKNKPKIDHPDKNKEMDIFMIRQDRNGMVTENVVVELKRPSVKLGEKEVSQVKKYMRVIKSEPRFNAGTMKWTFFLVGNEYDTSKYIEGELESHKASGQPFLIHTADNGLTNIYVLKWSEIFDSFSHRYEFLMEKLQFEQSLWLENHISAEEAVASLDSNTARLAEAVI